MGFFENPKRGWVFDVFLWDVFVVFGKTKDVFIFSCFFFQERFRVFVDQ